MVVEEYEMYQGDTGPVARPRPSALADGITLDANWHCYIAVNDLDGIEIVAKREVTDKDVDELRWIAALTPAEANLMVVESFESSHKYKMIIEVINGSVIPPFNIESHYLLKVYAQGIDP